LDRFNHFHVRFGFGRFVTNSRGVGLPRFGFSTLTATFTTAQCWRRFGGGQRSHLLSYGAE